MKHGKSAQFWRQQRLRQGLTQSQLGRMLAVAETFVSRVERGHCRYSLPQTKRLLRALDIGLEPVVDLLILEEERQLRRALKRAKKSLWV